MSKFEGKVIIITGAANGIGKAAAKKLAEQGARLSLVDLHIESVKHVIEEFGLDDSNAIAIQADVSRENEVQAYVAATIAKFGKIDGFFNNAGIVGVMANVEDYSTEVFEEVWRTNVSGVFHGLKHVVPIMKKQGFGSIVNTSSIAGINGTPGLIGYNSTKHAIIGMTKVVALEVASFGVRVNALAPGFIDTPMLQRIETYVHPEHTEEAKKALTSAVPMGDYGKAEEAANVALFLLSDDASYVTQSVYTVDGGLTNQ